MGSRFPFRQASDRGISRGEAQRSLEPVGSLSSSASFNAPSAVQLQRTDYRARIGKTAGLVRRNPLLMGRLGDRIYELLRADLSTQRQRGDGWHSRH
ncbi:MAG: hypothetical protein HC838_08240 [Spirulinaceae cyanobacterium RM2_2_10]|nr:hypothetical protein [Spirulinaceae cyanobacterium SM2_1_0]NJO20036.1 hypothetical protein [Spirulinaceae cyanobacterium RM2_2_10]